MSTSPEEEGQLGRTRGQNRLKSLSSAVLINSSDGETIACVVLGASAGWEVLAVVSCLTARCLQVLIPTLGPFFGEFACGFSSTFLHSPVVCLRDLQMD